MANKKKPGKSGLDEDLVRQLAGLLDETGLTEIEYGTEDWHLRVSRAGSGPVSYAVAAPQAHAAGTPSDSGAHESDTHANHPGVIVSPMVGTAYTSPEPDAEPFVKVGDEVKEGDTLILIEAMKVFNPVKAARDGKVSRVFIGNGTPVEFGEPLLIIE